MKKLLTNVVLTTCMIFGLLGPINGQTGISWKEAQRQDQSWYGSAEAKRIADNVLIYQHQNGGWMKNIDMAKSLNEEEISTLREEKKSKVGTTIDNGATFTQLAYLGKVVEETQDEKYKAAFLKGIDYLLAAQYDNGGWPQFYPIRNGYYQHITYNDNAMIGVMSLLREVAGGNSPYGFVDAKRKSACKEAIEKGLEIILKTQVMINGQKTIWCAQHDENTLEPVDARAFELASLSGAESVNIVRYLMQLPDPSPAVIEAVESAVSWFQSHQIKGKKLTKLEDKSLAKGFDLVLVDDKDASPLWARFYELETQQPIYVGRDGIKRPQLKDIEYERRVGYSYIGNYAGHLLEVAYPRWKAGR